MSLFIQLAQVSGTDIQNLGINLVSGSIFDILANVVNAILIFAGVIALIYLIIQGISYITAGGDAEKAATARGGVINAAIGIVIIAAALAIIGFVRNAVQGNLPAVSNGTITTPGTGGGTTTLSAPVVTSFPLPNESYRLDWNDISGATAYRAQWSKDSSFSKCLEGPTGGTSDNNSCRDSNSLSKSSYTISNPFSGQNFYRVRAGKAGGQSDWSTTGSFNN